MNNICTIVGYYQDIYNNDMFIKTLESEEVLPITLSKLLLENLKKVMPKTGNIIGIKGHLSFVDGRVIINADRISYLGNPNREGGE